MKELQLRKLAAPLAAARKDPAIGEAAVFVEHLFGRPMKSSPDILLVSDENREDYLKCLRHDFPKNGIAFMPPFILGEKGRRQVCELLIREGLIEEPIVLMMADLLRPLETYRRLKGMDRLSNGKRHFLEQIAGIDRLTRYEKLKKGLAGGVHLTEEGMVLGKKGDLSLVVHELVHSEDNVILGRIRTDFDRMLFEGRATFAERLFLIVSQGKHGMAINPESEYLPLALKRILERAPKMMARRAMAGFAATVQDIYQCASWGISNTSIAYQRYYLPYAIALFELSRTVGNAFKAFRLATHKPPATRSQMLKPQEFYAEEIRQIREAAPQ
jgi:hypothetical protein